MNSQNCVRRGNILRNTPVPNGVGCYQGNGRFGAVFGPWGLNRNPEEQKKNIWSGRSQFTHMGHWGRFRFVSSSTHQETTADYLLPLFWLHWEKEPDAVSDYRQIQDFYDGTVQTVFSGEGMGKVSVLSWFDWEDKDLAGFRIETEKQAVLCLSAVDSFIPYPFLYKTPTEQQFAVEETDGQWKITIACRDTINKASSQVYLKTTGHVEKSPQGLRIVLTPGRHRLFISYGKPVEMEAASFQRTVSAWHALWENSGLMEFSDDHPQQVFIRSLAYALCSYGDDCGAIQPTCGLTGNMFPFHFVQDMEYIAPALTMTGHGNIVRRWIEHFTGLIPDMRRYARRLWPETEGIYPPWELPYGDMEGYHTPVMPVLYCYEPHNVGYLCRMAAEASEEYGQAEWTKQYAEPLIRECAAFYRSAARRELDGHWHFAWVPSIGQDEAGGRNGKDYLCSLYSAAYCFQAAVRFGLDEQGQYQQMMKDGLAFPTLRTGDGIFHTALGAEDRGWQKHPIQLDGLSYMPVSSTPLPEERQAYAIRYDLTARAKEPFFFGWTLGEFLLAAANLGDIQGFRADWEKMRLSDYTDPEGVQFYETSGEAEKSYYITTHGLILQSLIRLYVNDYWGDLKMAACPVWDNVTFRNIGTRLGKTVSGKWQNGECTYEIAEEE